MPYNTLEDLMAGAAVAKLLDIHVLSGQRGRTLPPSAAFRAQTWWAEIAS